MVLLAYKSEVMSAETYNATLINGLSGEADLSAAGAHEQTKRLSFGPAQMRFLGKVAAGVGIGLLGASQLLPHQTIDGHIGPHRTEMQVTYNGHATIDLGPAGALRMPLDTPFGIGINAELKETSSTGKQLADEYIELIQHPEGEESYIKEAVISEAKKSALMGIAGGEAVVFGAAAGLAFYRRNKEQFHLSRRGIITGVGIVALTATGAGTPRLFDSVETAPDAWVSLRGVVGSSDVKLFPKEFQGVEVRGSELKLGIATGWPFIKEKFVTSQAYYSTMKQSFEAESQAIPAKENGEIRILVVADRHDNVAMDALIESAIKSTKPNILIDAGDDTSSGEAAEAFSINSLLHATHSVKNRLVVLGNHDSSYTDNLLVKGGYKSLEVGKPVTVNGIRFMGGADPRHSDLGMAIKPGSETIPQLGTELADAVCSDKEGIDVVVTHDPKASDEVADRGCTDFTISGHMHVQKGPLLQENTDGSKVYRFTNGTTGGAQEAISLGPLSNPADITMISYKIDTNKRAYPYGWQQYHFNKNGSVEIKPFEFAETLVDGTQKVTILRHNLAAGR